jgi:hypothetical protein
VLGEWVFHGPHAPGMIMPRECHEQGHATRHRVIGNYASTTGVIVLEHETTKARTEHDAHTPIISDLTRTP